MPERTLAGIWKRGHLGIAHHCGWAVLVTVADGELIDRRRVELVDDGLPNLPHHHDAQKLPIEAAIALVKRVQASAEKCAMHSLEALAREVSVEIAGVALRKYAPLPETIAERITNYRAQCVADSVMFRDALAVAAQARGWFVEWYDAKRVLYGPAQQLVERTGASVGPPWQNDHKVAMAAAISISDKGVKRARR